MRNVYLSVSFCLFTLSSLFAQTNSTQPLGYENKDAIKNLDAKVVAAPLSSEINSIKNGTHEKSGGMYIIGINQPAVMNTANSGIWTSENGFKVWRLKIKSNGAEALELMYSDFYLPEGAQLFVYNSDFTHKSRAYVGSENLSRGSFATEAIVGDEIIVEYMAPEYITESPILNIEEVSYIFRSGNTFAPRNASENGDSEACEVNVNCSEGSAWQDAKRGVAKIIVKDGNFTGLCTGSLVNNTSQNCRNYFLTAQHCGGAATTANLNQWIFYFNFESPDCDDLTNSEAGAVDNQTRTGCTRRAASGTISDVQKSDFLFVEITTAPPSSYNVYYNGWNRANTASTGGASIHHPAGDIKKISTYTGTLTSSSWTGTPNTHWRVTWTATANGHGVTEGGSSGSPIFNSSKLIVGDLSGGSSFCDATSDPDLYGKFSYSWDQAGTTTTTQLKSWLDSANTGVTSLTGRNACNVVPVAPVANFTATPTTVLVGDNVAFTQTCTNNPTTFAWSVSPNTGVTFQSGTTASSANPVMSFANVGQYTVTLTASNTAGSDGETKTNYITVYSDAGIEDVKLANMISIYPNPATDRVNIQINGMLDAEIEVRVVDMLGKQIVNLQQPAGSTFIQIPTESWAAGTYLVQIKSGNAKHVQRVIKN